MRPTEHEVELKALRHAQASTPSNNDASIIKPWNDFLDAAREYANAMRQRDRLHLDVRESDAELTRIGTELTALMHGHEWTKERVAAHVARAFERGILVGQDRYVSEVSRLKEELWGIDGLLLGNAELLGEFPTRGEKIAHLLRVAKELGEESVARFRNALETERLAKAGAGQ